MARIDAFLNLGLAQGCSDIHLAVGVPPMLRMNGDLMPIKFRELTDSELEGYVYDIISTQQKQRLEAGHDLDFSYVAEEGGRFRVNVFRKATGIGAVFRTIPGDVPTLDQLDVPSVLKIVRVSAVVWRRPRISPAPEAAANRMESSPRVSMPR